MRHDADYAIISACRSATLRCRYIRFSRRFLLIFTCFAATRHFEGLPITPAASAAICLRHVDIAALPRYARCAIRAAIRYVASEARR